MAKSPLHINISQQIQQKIDSGKYSPGDKLPSERELIKIYRVSRITVRRAIANLVQQGLVRTHQGKGVFVSEQRKVAYNLANPLTFLERDLQAKGISLSLQNLVFELVTPPPEVRAILNLPSRNPTAYLQKKLLLTDSVVGGMDITYILPELGSKLATELKANMTFPVLEQHNYKIDRVTAIIECTNANLELSKYLTVPLGHPLLVYRHTAYATNNRAVLHGETISRGDRFCYSVEQRL
ncbi:MAG: GntR family transcriptional regulator [Cyanobacteria bacterium P01_G01_bin.19]